MLARSSPEDKYLLVTRLNGTALPKDRAAWEEQHPQLKWETDKDRALPGHWDEVPLLLMMHLMLPPCLLLVEGVLG